MALNRFFLHIHWNFEIPLVLNWLNNTKIQCLKVVKIELIRLISSSSLIFPQYILYKLVRLRINAGIAGPRLI